MISEQKMCLVFLQQFQHSNVASVGCIVYGCVSLGIGLIEEMSSFEFNLCDAIALTFQIFAIVLQIGLQHFRLIVVGCVMNDCISMVISDYR